MRAYVDILWTWARDCLRASAPSILTAGAIVFAYYLGRGDADFWLVLVPLVFAGFGVGLAADRAEARATMDVAGRFIEMISSDHTLEVTITHKDERAERRAS